jgi:hypothetical protein
VLKERDEFAPPVRQQSEPCLGTSGRCALSILAFVVPTCYSLSLEQPGKSVLNVLVDGLKNWMETLPGYRKICMSGLDNEVVTIIKTDKEILMSGRLSPSPRKGQSGR